ncbi:MAG: diacylglycerol kinase [Dehalococcoidia bacterium]
MTYRVIQWSTGNVGASALRAIINHPELELTGVWVYHDEKAGRDAGELCGLEPVGVKATQDSDALLAAGADCVCYTSDVRIDPMGTIDEICRILRSGKNVVTSSLLSLVYPGALGPQVQDQFESACREGGVSLLVSGMDPGFANCTFPLIFSGMSERWGSIRIQEIVNYATYNQPEILFETMGFGKALDTVPPLLAPGALTFYCGGPIQLMAQGLGVEVEELREVHERKPAPTDLETPAGLIKEGTSAALRFEVQGIINGKPLLVAEHVTRMHDTIAPDWPQGHGYRLIIEGRPRMNCTFDFEDEHGDTAVGGVILTATRIVNAVPVVCSAEPGFISELDLPLITGRGLMA